MMLENITDETTLIDCPSYVERVGSMTALWPTETLKNEPMLFSASLDFAYSAAGPITHDWLDRLPPLPDAAIIDTRVHMLMPNFWPCIPGWHHDDVPRERGDGQPNYFAPSYRTTHIATVVGDTAALARTEFALGDCSFPDVPLGEKFYKVWSPMVDEAIADGLLRSHFAAYGALVAFNDRTWHRGTQADTFGWRWFGRVTIGSQRPIVNEIRRQVQVYMADPIEGW